MAKKVKKKAYVNSSVKWEYDFDYLHKLTDEEREWLARFVREYINGYPCKENPIHDKEGMRQNYNKKNRANRDMYANRKKVRYED
jgi:hypothetical protein